MSDDVKKLEEQMQRSADVLERTHAVNGALQQAFRPNAPDGYEFALIVFSIREGIVTLESTLVSRPAPVPSVFPAAIKEAAARMGDPNNIIYEHPADGSSRYEVP